MLVNMLKGGSTKWMMSSKMNTTKYLLGVYQKRYDFNKLSDGDNTPFIPKGMIEKET